MNQSTTTQEIHTQVTGEEIAHVFDEATPPADLSGYGIEDWFTLAAFWLMVGCVVLQFFTRYVLNDSFAWTEEIAIYALIVVVFLGSALCVRASRHIQVDFIYRYVSPGVGRALATFVDVVRIGFFGYATWLVYKYASLIPDEMMTTINVPKSIVFYAVVIAFALMTLRALHVAWQSLRRGYSVLENPAAFDGSEA
ncbi:TRAP transporter small permease [Bosea caraganae]|uniref:TRAP transporter small permease protein n=1 Tax=Bosea caraganae TaxID=2763117 RepID=A0A370L4T2_9HYPH|nr:TRAP transporter small permease [Bosea caraganae]RDJ22310.1 TRAP transporter small permease [Bosea caraganae]RDJ23756.1 TRAP transporter small permease [Bosea caraganae]